MDTIRKFCFLLLLAGIRANPWKIDHSLQKVLQFEGTANVFVSFRVGTQGVLNPFSQRTFETRGDKIRALTMSLKIHAGKTQAPVYKILDEEFPKVTAQSFWISNQVYIKDAPQHLVQKISQVPSVAVIHEEEEIELMMPVIEALDSTAAVPIAEWSISLIQAPEAWGMDGGNDGENVVVSTIDSGVRYTHEALRDNFLGAFGWFDPYKFTTEPNDQSGHGTHVTGTIAGQGGIGVAPGAKWMACKGCDGLSCPYHGLLSCGQFILCPTDTQGQNEDCSKAPHLVSNSWGGAPGMPVFHDVINAWIAADIVPIFANGNSGPRCGSAMSPADHKGVIAVGSTTKTDSLSEFSSVGPSFYGDIKPDVCGPGESVRSSYYRSDTSYVILSGTSMACPHTAGVVALLKGRDQKLSIQDVKKHLFKGIDRTVKPTGQNCGGMPEDTFPNNVCGHGRINAFKALVSLLEDTP